MRYTILLLTAILGFTSWNHVLAQGNDTVIAYYEERIRALTSRVEDLTQSQAELVKAINTQLKEEHSGAFLKHQKSVLAELCDVLGIILEEKQESADAEIEELIAQRQAARKNKDFAKADEIRDRLLSMGIILEDTREGVKWKRQ